MRQLKTIAFVLFFLTVSAFGQTFPYVLQTFAGTFPLGDGGPANSALLYYPNAVVTDSAGNIFILDSSNFLIRKVTSDRRITTFARLDIYTYDMKRGADGTLYVGGVGQVLKVSTTGVVTPIAGTGTYGYAGDGGPALSAQVGDVYGLAVDSIGQVYFSDVSSSSSHRIRMIGTDQRVTTIAGGAQGFAGDNLQATSARFNYPSGIAIDSNGTIYVADYDNSRVRRFTVGGTITTFAGNGTFGTALNGPATASRLGSPDGLCVDSRNNVYFTDYTFNVALKVTNTGSISVVAGNFDGYSTPQDGVATSVSLRTPQNIFVDAGNNILVVDYTHRVRQISTDGNLTTVAGRLHFAGDNGPASSAILNEPSDFTFDSQGNAYIADASNYLIRKVTPSGTISTYVGKINPGVPGNGSFFGNAQLPYVRNLLYDSRGNLYIVGNYQIFRVNTDGIVNTWAGTGFRGDTGDGGKATNATFGYISGAAVDAGGNLYVIDYVYNRIRLIDSGGAISAFAGSRAYGFAGDGGLATGAAFRFGTEAQIAVDSKGNVFIADTYNYRVRMVNSQGLISTVVGNGNYGRPADGATATAAPFNAPGGIAFDAAGNMYVASYLSFAYFPDIFKVSNGVIRRIAAGNNEPVDGAAALNAYFHTRTLKVDANGDIYSVDTYTSSVRKLVVNSPSGVVVVDGDGQTAPAGQALAKLLKVRVNGRAGVGVAGLTVNFAITAGAGRLSAASAQTDADGLAAVSLTLGANAGTVTVSAALAGLNLPAATFTATATGAPPTCGVPTPVINSVRSAGDFGGSATFASGSWLEIKGSNLSATTRSWGGGDFNGANAPTTLDGVVVTINGKRAFIGYISPSQVNVQAPGDSLNGSVDVTVTTASCASATVTGQKAAVAGGLLAPGVFNVGGTPYAAALFQDGFTFVGRPGLIAGVPFRPAAPGDIITLYGIGFGDVTPSIPPGVIVSDANTLPGLAVSFGSTPATVSYAGLAPSAVGLYQFNVTVPNVADGDYLIVVRVGSAAIPQTVYLTVKR